jgi:hypothetical protein
MIDVKYKVIKRYNEMYELNRLSPKLSQSERVNKIKYK